MRIRTLGGLALDGASFTRPKPLLLLAYLALEGEQERRYLAELFWSGASDPLKSLTVALSQLRQGAPGAIHADRQRAWTRLPCDAVELLERLQRGEADEQPWRGRGPFLDGFYVPNLGVELEEWIYRTRELVQARVHQARLDLAERAAGQQHYEAAAEHAERAIGLVAMAPEPEQLARLHTLLLAGRSPLAARARAEVEGYGIALASTSQEARERLAATRPSFDPGAPAALPKRATSFVGRDLELTEIGTMLAQDGGRIISLVGPGGVGKTRLALQVAHEQRRLGTYRDGVYFVPLAPLRSAGAIPSAIVAAVGHPVDASSAPLDQALAAIGQREILLVCDGLEHLMDGAHALAAITAGCPRLRVLVTSRERAKVEEERVFDVGGLAYPVQPEVDDDEALQADAVRLFLQRSARARPGFALAADDLQHVLQVCRLVEGLPLGLELAASWVRVMPVAEIAVAIDHDIDILASDARDTPERHRSVSAAFERSWSLLGERERSVLRRLAIFRGGFRREAAGAVVGATIATLASLVDKSLLRSGARGRFERHTLLYQFTQQKLAEVPAESADAAARHASYFLGMLREARAVLRGAAGEDQAAGQRAALDAIEQESENVRAAFAVADPAADPAAYLEAVDALATFFEVRSRLREGVAFFRACLAAAPAEPATVRAGLSVAQARLHRALGEYREANAVAGAALEGYRAAEDVAGACQALQVLGVTALHLGDHAGATRQLEEAVGSVGPEDTAGERGSALANLALALQLSGEPVAAMARLHEALAAFREQGDGLREARLLNNMGLLHFEQGDRERARQVWEEGLVLARRVDSRRDALSLTANLGMVHAAMELYLTAREYDEHALRVARAIGDRVNEAAALARLALIDVAQDQAERAEQTIHQAIDLAWRIGEVPRVLEFLKVLADVRSRGGDAVQALTLYALVEAHEATTRATREQAAAAFTQLAPALPEAAVAAAREQATATWLDAAVTRVVGIPL